MKYTPIRYQAMKTHHLFPMIDLSRASGKYVLVDPINNSNLLYVTEKVYLRLMAIAMSNDETLTALIVPGESVPIGPDGHPLPPSDGKDNPSGGSITPSDLKRNWTRLLIFLRKGRYIHWSPITVWILILAYLAILGYQHWTVIPLDGPPAVRPTEELPLVPPQQEVPTHLEKEPE